MSTHDLIGLIILIIVSYLCVHSVIDRICKCVENCTYAKCGRMTLGKTTQEKKKAEELTESE